MMAVNTKWLESQGSGHETWGGIPEDEVPFFERLFQRIISGLFAISLVSFFGLPFHLLHKTREAARSPQSLESSIHIPCSRRRNAYSQNSANEPAGDAIFI
jgi:hypothetical protein